MYIPKHFSAPSDDALQELIRAYPFATLIMTTGNGLEVNHLPLYLDDNGRLGGHLARANPLWKAAQEGIEVLAVFHGPHSYVSPTWYPTKARTGQVVPTWNYVVVHARGVLQVKDDANWLRGHLAALTGQQEGRFAQPWRLEDAPDGFIDQLMQAVVGIEIDVTGLTGKWKVSQNQPLENQLGVIDGLAHFQTQASNSVAKMMKSMVANNQSLL